MCMTERCTVHHTRATSMYRYPSADATASTPAARSNPPLAHPTTAVSASGLLSPPCPHLSFFPSPCLFPTPDPSPAPSLAPSPAPLPARIPSPPPSTFRSLSPSLSLSLTHTNSLPRRHTLADASCHVCVRVRARSSSCACALAHEYTCPRMCVCTLCSALLQVSVGICSLNNSRASPHCNPLYSTHSRIYTHSGWGGWQLSAGAHMNA